jgi:hypothetical protein
MVIVSRHIRYDLPGFLADHMAATWRAGVPHEKPLYVLDLPQGEIRMKVTEIQVDTFPGRVTERVL